MVHSFVVVRSLTNQRWMDVKKENGYDFHYNGDILPFCSRVLLLLRNNKMIKFC
jgi:hypothetical protein